MSAESEEREDAPSDMLRPETEGYNEFSPQAIEAIMNSGAYHKDLSIVLTIFALRVRNSSAATIHFHRIIRLACALLDVSMIRRM